MQLITDGDVAGVIATTDPATGIDIYIGQGGAPEGVLAAAALRCVGGQIQTRLVFRKDDERARAAKLGITDFNRKYSLMDLASGDVMFSATGVTDGSMLRGVQIDARVHHHRKHRDALGHRHGALDQGAPSPQGCPLARFGLDELPRRLASRAPSRAANGFCAMRTTMPRANWRARPIFRSRWRAFWPRAASSADELADVLNPTLKRLLPEPLTR